MLITSSTWGNQLRTLRIHRGMKLAELAEMSGVSSNQISKLEQGKVEPTEITKSKLAKAFGMKVAELFPYDIYPGGDAR